MNYGCCLMGKGEYGKALSYFEQALAYSPFYDRLFINLAIVKKALKRAPAEVEANFRKALEYGANYYGSYFFYAQWLDRQKKDAEAVPFLIKTLQLSPSFMEARYLLMDIYSRKHQWKQLSALAKETLNINSHDRKALSYLKMGEQPLSQTPPAPGSMIETVKSNPTPENYLTLSLSYYQKRQFEKCIRACNEAIKLKPDYAEAFNNLGAAYNCLDRWDEAAAACEKALTIRPDFTLAGNNLEYANRHRKVR